MNHSPVVWTIWMQGMDAAPPVVQKCYESMKRNISDREIIVITDENYSHYVNLPDYIIDKYQKGIISKTHFADILRIELLAKYGGYGSMAQYIAVVTQNKNIFWILNYLCFK